MSTAEGWDLTVPEDAAELAAELRRHGVQPGEHIRILRSPEHAPEPLSEAGEPTSQRRRRFSFIGAAEGGPSDVSERTDEYLSRGFGRA